MLKKHEELLLLCSQIEGVGRPASSLHRLATTHAVDAEELSLPKACATLDSLAERGLMEKRVLPDVAMKNGKRCKTYSITNTGNLELDRSLRITANLLILVKASRPVTRAA